MELRTLSSDHHRALVIAKRARQASGEDESALTRLWAEIETAYRSELERHFAIEERYLSEPLRAVGETNLVERLLGEHRQLRSHFTADAERSLDALHRFGELLAQHVRFEEREFFNTAEERLDAHTLAAVEAACEEGAALT
ncbi:hemerythrin domain-containing protein [Marinobacterium sp. D7]|uniref:hemerythrin domain-containing protein n=1 Tax=Marinobacterium ramblicola TaxID=2849041 RepID=UPI001C2D0504|nr:hemerythrin domain-containing protein [Marinobacterium ramblicola]MBV1789610.1 hemerythrin domain-containing protein [Marinobacterium ramblicola]